MATKQSGRLVSGKMSAAAECPFKLLVQRGGPGGGNDASMAEWFRPYQGLITGLLRKAGINDSHALDDIRSLVMLNFAVSVLADRYDPSRGTIGGYLWGLAKNTGRSEIRRSKRFRKSLDDPIGARKEAEGPDAEAASREVQQIIRSAIAQLPPRYRTALCVEYRIPDLDGVIPAPVEPRNDMVLFRGRRRLRDLLAQRYPDIAVLF